MKLTWRQACEEVKNITNLLKTSIEFGFSMMRTIKMQTSVAVFHDDSLLDVDNFSHYTQHHSIIVKSKG